MKTVYYTLTPHYGKEEASVFTSRLKAMKFIVQESLDVVGEYPRRYGTVADYQRKCTVE